MIFANLRAQAWKWGAIALAVLAVAAVLAAAFFRSDSAVSRLRAEAATGRAEALERQLAVVEAVMIEERAKAQAMARIAQTHEVKLDAIEADSERRIAELESGALRVRKLWAGCETDLLSGTAAGAAELARQDRLRRESAERVVRAVETVQAQRDGLQAVTQADRE